MRQAVLCVQAVQEVLCDALVRVLEQMTQSDNAPDIEIRLGKFYLLSYSDPPATPTRFWVGSDTGNMREFKTARGAVKRLMVLAWQEEPR